MQYVVEVKPKPKDAIKIVAFVDNWIFILFCGFHNYFGYSPLGLSPKQRQTENGRRTCYTLYTLKVIF